MVNPDGSGYSVARIDCFGEFAGGLLAELMVLMNLQYYNKSWLIVMVNLIQ